MKNNFAVYAPGKRCSRETEVLKILDDPGNFALKGFHAIKKIIIGNMVTDVGIRAFSDCSSLTEFEVEKGNQYFAAVDGILYDKKLKKIIAVPAGLKGSFTVADGVEELSKYSFAGCENITSVVIPDSAAKMGSGVFLGCQALESVRLPKSLDKIGAKTFEQCISLKRVALPPKLRELPNAFFKDCWSLEKVENIENIIKFGDSVFENCEHLKSICFSDMLSEIGSACFNGCKSLESLVLPAGLQKLGNNAVAGCAALKSFEIPANVVVNGGYNFDGCGSIEYIKINNGVRSNFGMYSFKDCQKLRTVIISDDKLHESAVEELKKITELRVTEDNTRYCLENGALYSKDKKELILVNQKAAGEFVIPDTVEKIGSLCFSFCVRLTKVVLPKGLKYIGKKAFYSCVGLTGLDFVGGELEISMSAFESCRGLKSIIIQCDKLDFDAGAFLQCDRLECLDLCVSDDLTIPTRAFANIKGKMRVNLKGKTVTVGAYAFINCDSLISVTADAKTIDVSYRAFGICVSLKKLYLGAKIITIDDQAFYCCSELETAEFKYDVEPITEKRPELEKLLAKSKRHSYISLDQADHDNMPTAADSVKISFESFKGCKSLKELRIVSRSAKIEPYAFTNNTSLSKICIPANIQMSHFSFGGCTDIKACEIKGNKNELSSKGLYELLEILIPLVVYDHRYAYCKDIEINKVSGYTEKLFTDFMHYTERGFEYSASAVQQYRMWGQEHVNLLFIEIMTNNFWMDYFAENGMLSNVNVEYWLERCQTTEKRTILLEKMKLKDGTFGNKYDLDDDL